MLRLGAVPIVGALGAFVGLVAALSIQAAAPLPTLAAITPVVCDHPSDSLQRRLCADEPAVFDPRLGDWERTSLLRDWAYAHVVESASPATLDGRDFTKRSAPAIFEGFRSGVGGVFCYNAAVALRQLYAYFGYDAWVLDVGLPKGGFTHTTTLVRLPDRRNKIVVQDSFLGGSFGPIDVRMVLARIASGKVPRWTTSSNLHKRKVLYAPTEARPHRAMCAYNGRDWECLGKLTIAIVPTRPTIPETLRQMRLDGHSGNVLNIFLYPLNVIGPGSDGLLHELKAAAA